MSVIQILTEALELEKSSRDDRLEKFFIAGYEMNNLQRLKLEESGKILTLQTIQKICLKFQLLFLDLQLFKGEMPDNARKEIHRISEEYNIQLEAIRLLKPKNYLGIEDRDVEPILLAKIEDSHYLLIH